MTILKCKMCGGELQTTDNAYGTCEHCGSTMTLPKASDDRKANLFNRANHYRRQNEFDKAIQAYEGILNEDSTDAEAYWGVVLSKYGIEYVEDPTSHQMVPTCHRVQSDPILSDPDYLATLQNAPDAYTKSIYEEEANKICEIQKGILAISNKEEPYHVFICYKETTDGGSRTKDSTIAQDIYHQLTNDGYRVFFSRITLEDKLGTQYEPYIFSALNSAKVMLVIGTAKEYFNAVWVKNEWSRFLAITKKDRSRLLIPCYKDMDAYDIPDELSSLQSQDMSKIGFIQDILRGIKKVLDAGKTTEKSTPASSISSTAAPGVESLMKRGWLFLEDSDWQSGNEYFDKVLDIDPECAAAYVGKLCAELNVRHENELGKCVNPLANNKNYQKAVRFGDAGIQGRLKGYDDGINNRIAEEKRKEVERIAEKKRKEVERIAEEKRKEIEKFNQSLEQIKKHQKDKPDISQKNSEMKKQYDNEVQSWQDKVNTIQNQANLWKSQKKCHHCGGDIGGLFTKTCKKCGKKESDPIKTPLKPAEPTYLTSNQEILDLSITLFDKKWKVLDVKQGKALIISENIIEERAYHDTKTDITWEDCDLRKYLNSKYYQSLPEIFRNRISETNLINENNQWYGTNGGKNTTDKIFLLSISEVVRYFGDSGQLTKRPKSDSWCIDDQYNSKRVANFNVSACWIWLRSPGDNGYYASEVNFPGNISMYGHNVNHSSGGVRPALWLNL